MGNDGLNTLIYTVVHSEKESLYTHVMVKYDGPKPNKKCTSLMKKLSIT